ncbi:GerAB/ArcD/ProY family transporter [Paenibacillus sp. MMS20-IR301]|uniref:GerAB/ArcD/ProY family transporter n=1 Tax=Paenibacillus sp. MMS20-IR301 TaxID=2895946 RepID=UPI0028EEBA50|nr:GerAB/ArcD/ProY family transporter [Paenibacillus sp. MMS20-IR301]WNS44417.1 GerAB/ArcD/ProY family transporter [Paenibacillus sp. MMS20-IR301]
MRKEVISPGQLFAMIVLYELGTALVVPVGLESGHAVWLSILFALPGGILLYLVFADLYLQFPDQVISGYARKILGKWIGWPVGLLFLPVLLYNGSRNLRESGDLLISASYDKTPIFIINSIMVVAVMYILIKGIEVFSRTAEIFLWIIIVMGLICNFIVLASGLVEYKNLFPLHGSDLREALKSAYPNIWIFPFGELVCFTTIMPQFNKARKIKKTGMLAITVSACLLSFTHAVEMGVLGENLYSRTTFPMFTTITLVNVANFIQRLDAFVMLTLIIGVFFKMSVYCYAAVTIAADLFKVRNSRKLIIPAGVVMLFSSIISAENFPVHMNDGKVFLENILPVFCAVIPILLYLIHRIRRKFGLYR